MPGRVWRIITPGLGVWSMLPPKECFAATKDAALRALELDPTLAEAHSSLVPERYVSPYFVGIMMNGTSFDILHHEVGEPVVGGAAVKQPCNVGMVKVRQDLALVSEAPDEEVHFHAPANEFDGHPSFKFIVSARTARYTAPIPPRPISRTVRYAPMRRPIIVSSSF